MQMLINLVYVHDEAHRVLANNELRKVVILRLLAMSISCLHIRVLQNIYGSYLDWLEFVRDISPLGKLQVGLEVQFINAVVDPFAFFPTLVNSEPGKQEIEIVASLFKE